MQYDIFASLLEGFTGSSETDIMDVKGIQRCYIIYWRMWFLYCISYS